MAYIYQIENLINGKLYIGKSDYSLEKRFKEHCRDSKKPSLQNRPLYRAFNKYGIENFQISLIEETSTPDEREIFWIEQKQSFKNGYNATKGGDGKHYVDYELINALWEKGYGPLEIAKLTGYCKETVSRGLKNSTVTQEMIYARKFENQQKPVCKIDKQTDEILYVYKSISEAESCEQTNKHIQDVCKGKRKTAGGFKWKYLKDI